MENTDKGGASPVERAKQRGDGWKPITVAKMLGSCAKKLGGLSLKQGTSAAGGDGCQRE
jgi:hypothetical protein